MSHGTTIAVMALVAATVAMPLAGSGIAVADASGPTITLRADGSTITDGNSIRVASNPELEVSATAETDIGVVSVRIDGRTVETFDPNGNRGDYTVTPELSSGDHTLTVVAHAETTSTVQATITKDAIGPEVRFTSPFLRNRDAAKPDRIVLSNASVTLAGRVFDQSNVSSIRIERSYSFGAETVHDVYDLKPGESFEQSIFLGYGTNVVTVTTRDELGNVETYEVELVARDNRAPNVTVTDVEWLSASSIRVTGYAEDDVQLKSVTVGKTSVTDRRVLLATEDREPDRSGRRAEFTGVVSTPREALLITATDHSGKTTTQGVRLSSFAVPEVHLDESATARTDDGVYVEGVVLRGAVSDVTVETVSKETGRIVDVAVPYHGRPTETRIPFETRLEPADGPTTVRVRVLDATGTEHILRRTVVPESTATATATATAEPAATDRPSDADSTATPSDDAASVESTAPADDGGIRLEIPVVGVGVTIPGPSALGFTLGVPLTGMSVNVPGVGVLGGIALVLGGTLVGRFR
ncbi:hypothetical protein [Salinirarus marinus]|uniref:hypothetical protein n=1 Tax=Salinirarus marinus TaxID=3068310 RepID=UPI003C6CAA2C